MKKVIDKKLKKYLKENILPIYKKNDWAHQAWHIYEVIERSLKLAQNYDVDINMVYTIAIFHDIACYKGRKNHEVNSALMLQNDETLKKFFNNEKINIMAEAVIDHRASLEYVPRSIYGKIISTADRFISMKSILRSTHSYSLEFKSDKDIDEMFEISYDYIKKKYGQNGYGKIYLSSEDYESFLKEVDYYLNHPFEMKKLLFEVDKFLRKEYHLNPIHYPELKRYNSLDEYYKKKYGTKVYKISLNAGFSCPNKINGTGCIFCKNESGDFAGDKKDDLITQFKKIEKQMKEKWQGGKLIAYFQAGTNTYAPLNILKEKYESVLSLPNVIGISIATRSDAITDEVLDYLEDLNRKTELTIELGLQSIHEKTLKLINRGHTKENFEQMVYKLHKRNINVVVHIINGLPYETKEDMLKTVKYINKLPISGIKIHMLHILKDTPLALLYQKKKFHVLTEKEYVDIVCDELELLNQNIVIHRLTGDPKKEDLIAPNWLLKKFVVLNHIEKELEKRNTYQGKLSS